MNSESQRMKRILVVDDEVSIREGLTKLLEMDGYEVSNAPSGMIARHLVNQQDFDLMISDVFMENGDGLNLLLEVRSLLNAPKILIMSGGGRHRKLGILKIAEQYGCDSTIKKPFTNGQLLDEVHGLLGDQPVPV